VSRQREFLQLLELPVPGVIPTALRRPEGLLPEVVPRGNITAGQFWSCCWRLRQRQGSNRSTKANAPTNTIAPFNPFAAFSSAPSSRVKVHYLDQDRDSRSILSRNSSRQWESQVPSTPTEKGPATSPATGATAPATSASTPVSTRKKGRKQRITNGKGAIPIS
jgi:hypothetical protein